MHPGAFRIIVEAPGMAAEARPDPETARVRLRIHLGEDGSVERVTIAATSGRTELDTAAARAARLWRFAPARRDGAPIRSVVLVWVAFHMEP